MIRGTRLLLLAALATLFTAAPAQAQTPTREQVERLAGLGQVWGFLKYFHPGVAAGTIHWDSMLVAMVPQVKAARTAADYHTAIDALIDAPGPVPPCANCRNEYPDSMLINLDLRWMHDARLFTPAIARRLEHIRENRHQGRGRYVQFPPPGIPRFDPDSAFAQPAYPDEAVRLLALFRAWNAVHYYFPYKYVNDGDWNDVLAEFIPRMVAARDAEEYHFTAVELMARVNDTHVNAGSSVVGEVLGGRSPAFEARSIEGQVVVWRLPRGAAADPAGLLVGDVITHIDGVPVAQLRARLGRYVSAGSAVTHERKLVTTLLRGRHDSTTYTVQRGSETLQRRIAMAPVPAPAAGGAPARPVYPVAELAKVLPGNIGYIDMGDIEGAQVDSALAIVRNTDGIVMDVRNYPRGTMHRFTAFFNPDARPFAKFTRPDSLHPGVVVWEPAISTGLPGGNPNHYRGRVAILMDERSQSHAEFSIMALRTAPNNRVFGSATAGADGNVTPFRLPGGIFTLFTGLGVYYPDGGKTQRIGLLPDVEVVPTLAGVRAGRDEVLERALEWIRTGYEP